MKSDLLLVLSIILHVYVLETTGIAEKLTIPSGLTTLCGHYQTLMLLGFVIAVPVLLVQLFSWCGWFGCTKTYGGYWIRVAMFMIVILQSGACAIAYGNDGTSQDCTGTWWVLLVATVSSLLWLLSTMTMTKVKDTNSCPNPDSRGRSEARGRFVAVNHV